MASGISSSGENDVFQLFHYVSKNCNYAIIWMFACGLAVHHNSLESSTMKAYVVYEAATPTTAYCRSNWEGRGAEQAAAAAAPISEP